ncbi:MAG: H-NS histone family protein, partial [Alcaligenaceae bacterium]|nr:H-NS histone family protein [Alcaligenaceae bacterium]
MASQNYTTQQAQINKKIEKLQKQALLLASKSRKPILNGLVRTMKEHGI